MKKKSLFGINVKLALMLVAICGMFASCYEKEELTTEAPSTVKPVYKITGVVSNASTGEPFLVPRLMVLQLLPMELML